MQNPRLTNTFYTAMSWSQDVALVTVACFVLLLAVPWCVIRWRFRKLIANASAIQQGLPSYPIVGMFYNLVLHGVRGLFAKADEAIREAAIDNVRTVCFWIGPYPEIVVVDPDDIKKILCSSTTLDKGYVYDFLKCFVKGGIFIATGKKSKIIRKYMHQMFQSRNLQTLTPVIHNTAKGLVKYFSGFVASGEIDVQKAVGLFTNENISYFIFGPEIKIDIQSKLFQEYNDTVERLAWMPFQRMSKPWLWPDFIMGKVWKKELEFYQKSLKNFVQIALKNILQSKINSSLEMANASGDYVSLVEVYNSLRRDHPEFTDQDFADEVLTISAGGTGTGKSSISSCMLAIAANNNIQERLFEEIVRVAGPDDSLITPELLNKMPYLDQVIKETFRYFGTVPYLMRRTSEDLKLKDITIPAGCSVTISLKGLQYDPNYFANPEKFDPYHFGPANEEKIKKALFIPFSMGSRVCPGKAYGMQFVKTLIIHIVRNFRLTTSVDIYKLKYTLALSSVSEDGYHMEFHDRKISSN